MSGQNGRNGRDKNLLDLMPRCMDCWQVFGQVMARMGLIHAEALNDPMGYDNGQTEGLVIDLHALVVEYYLQRTAADTVRMDWLERNLMTLSHNRATSSVYMGGECVHGQLVNEARGRAAGPSTFRVLCLLRFLRVASAFLITAGEANPFGTRAFPPDFPPATATGDLNS